MKLIARADHHYALEGQLDMDSVGALQPQLVDVLRGGEMTLDLSGISKADSAALALLLEALRSQQRQGGSLRLCGMPASLIQLARLYDIAELLPLEN